MNQENDYYGEQNLACFFFWVFAIIGIIIGMIMLIRLII
jgi:hypothetical protein